MLESYRLFSSQLLHPQGLRAISETSIKCQNLTFIDHCTGNLNIDLSEKRPQYLPVSGNVRNDQDSFMMTSDQLSTVISSCFRLLRSRDRWRRLEVSVLLPGTRCRTTPALLPSPPPGTARIICIRHICIASYMLNLLNHYKHRRALPLPLSLGLIHQHASKTKARNTRKKRTIFLHFNCIDDFANYFIHRDRFGIKFKLFSCFVIGLELNSVLLVIFFNLNSKK